MKHKKQHWLFILAILSMILLITEMSLIASQTVNFVGTSHPVGTTQNTHPARSASSPARPLATATTLTCDLTIQKPSYSPSNPKTGDFITFKATASNSGNFSLKNVPVYFYIDRTKIGKTTLKNIKARESKTVTVTYKPKKAGKITFKAFVDPKNKIKETNEKNNTASVSLTISPKASLATATVIPARRSGHEARHPSQGEMTHAQISHVKIYNVTASVKGNSLNIHWNKKAQRNSRVKILLYPEHKPYLAKAGRGIWLTRNTPNDGYFNIPLTKIKQSGRFVARIQTVDNRVYHDSNPFTLPNPQKPPIQKGKQINKASAEAIPINLPYPRPTGEKGKLVGKPKQTNRPSAKAIPINLPYPRPKTMKGVRERTPSTFHKNNNQIFEGSINGIVVTSPQKDDQWNPGKSHTISWVKEEKVDFALNITVRDAKSHMKVWTIAPIVKSGKYGGSIHWKIPTDFPAGQYIVRIETASKSKKHYSDDSDLFQVKAERLEITIPGTMLGTAKRGFEISDPNPSIKWFNKMEGGHLTEYKLSTRTSPGRTISWQCLFDENTIKNSDEKIIFKLQDKNGNVLASVSKRYFDLHGWYNWKELDVPMTEKTIRCFIRMETGDGQYYGISKEFELIQFQPPASPANQKPVSLAQKVNSQRETLPSGTYKVGKIPPGVIPLKLGIKLKGYNPIIGTYKSVYGTGARLDGLEIITEINTNKPFKFENISFSEPQSLADWSTATPTAEIQVTLQGSEGGAHCDAGSPIGGYGIDPSGIYHYPNYISCKMGGNPALVVPKGIIPQGKSIIKFIIKNPRIPVHGLKVIGIRKGSNLGCVRVFKPYICVTVYIAYYSESKYVPGRTTFSTSSLYFDIPITNPAGFETINTASNIYSFTTPWKKPVEFSKCDYSVIIIK